MIPYDKYDIVFQEIPNEVSLAFTIKGCPNMCPGCHSPHLRDQQGKQLTIDLLDELIEQYGKSITTVLFLGGDRYHSEIMLLCDHVKLKGLKTAFYSGLDQINKELVKHLDYYKIGSYIDYLGGLEKRSTNQILYHIKGLIMTDISHKISVDKKEDALYIQLGFIQGDGDLARLTSTAHRGMEINIGVNDEDVFSIFQIEPKKGKTSYYTRGFNEICRRLEFVPKQLPERSLPLTFNTWTYSQRTSFLKGVYSANGSFIKRGRIALKTTCKQLLDEIKSELESLGYHPYFTTNKPKEVEFENGVYLCKQSYDLNIARQKEIHRFYYEIGFVHEYKMNNVREFLVNKGLMKGGELNHE